MILRFDVDDLIRELDEPTYDRGLSVWARDLVRRVEVSADGTRVSANVSGSRRAPYSQSIVLAERNGKLRITGYCTCPVAFNCKHVAAVLHDVVVSRRDQAHAIVENTLKATAGVGADRAQASARPSQPPAHLASSTLPALIPLPPPVPTLQAPSVSRDVANWLERLGAAAGPVSSTAAVPIRPAKPPRVLLYILNPEAVPGRPAPRGVSLRPVSAKPRMDGSFGSDIKTFDPENITRTLDQRARFLTDTDIAVMRDLVWLKREANTYRGTDTQLGTDTNSRRALDGALATGRVRYGGANGPALAVGPAVAAQPQWIKTANGQQRLAFVPIVRLEAAAGPVEPAIPAAPPRFDVILPLAPPLYIDFERGFVGEIDSGLPPAVALEVAQAPPIGAAEAGLVKELMRQKLTVPRAASIEQPASAAADAPVDRVPAVVAPAETSVLLPLPEALDNVEVRRIVPVPRLELFVVEASLKPAYQWYAPPVYQRGTFSLPVARLVFDYAGETIANAAEAATLQRIEGDRLILTPRDQRAELAAAERLKAFHFRLMSLAPFQVEAAHSRDLFLYPEGNPTAYELLPIFDAPERFLAFSSEGVRALAAEGWQIAYADDYPYELAEGDASWWADVGEGSGIDWFSFELGIEYEGHRINLVPQLAGMLGRLPAHIMQLATQPGDGNEFIAACKKLTFYHTLPDGRMLPLPGERLAPMLKALLELIGQRSERLVNGKVKLHRAEAGLLAEIADITGTEVAWAASAERLMTLGKNLRRGRGLEPVLPPPTFKASLRPYQGEGLAWLDFLRDAGFGGVLADDMGLGKTVQALAFLTREKAHGRLDKPALIVAPTSVLPNWQSEAEKFAPDLKVLALRGFDRKALFAEIPNHDIVLTTYPLLARDHEVLLAQEFHVAILDEAQAIKNPRATVTGLAHRINARHRFALTGTPLENNLGEVWSLFEFLSPGLLGDESMFRRTFRTPIEKHGDANAQAFLSRRLKPFLLRRTKAEVATELPPKTEIIERIQLEGPQRDLYETVRSLMHEKVRDEIAKKGLAKSHIIFLDALLKLRQICCDPRLLKMTQARKVQTSAKLERLMEMIPEMVAEGRRILLFSQFTSMLALIEDELNKLKIPYVQLTGQTTDRAEPVKAFQSGKVPLFLLSLKAGGTGLNLTAADTVIHYDPWWNPAVENQATDRAYRIGQDKPVFVYKMIVDEGIETAIEQLKARKSALADALFAGASKAPLDLTEADISALFAPLSPVGGRSTGKQRAA